MVQINYRDREIVAKVVYYGPALSGKTTNLQFMHECINYSHPTQFYSLNTKNDRTLFFDLLPINLGKVNDFTIRIQLYTVPGQVQYNSTRKVVLVGCDAIVFVADSQRSEQEANLFSLTNMKSNLRANGLLLEQIPWVLQYNKRDLPNIMSAEEINQALNKSSNIKYFNSVATTGEGVYETFAEIIGQMLESVLTKYRMVRGTKELQEVQQIVVTNLATINEKYKEAKDRPSEQIPAEGMQPPVAEVPDHYDSTEAPPGSARSVFPESGKPYTRQTFSGAAVQVDDQTVPSMETTQPITGEGMQARAFSTDYDNLLREDAPDQYKFQSPHDLASKQRQVTKFTLGQSPALDGQSTPAEQEFLTNEQLVETAVQANMKITELSNKLAESEMLLEKKLKEIELMGEIGKMLTSELNLNRLMDMCIQATAKRLKAPFASISLYDKERNIMEPSALYNLREDPISKVLGEKLIKFLAGIVSRGKMAVITSAENKSLANALNRFDNYTSFISVSLRFKAKLLGILNIYYKGEETYQKDDLRFIVMLATYASVAIQNALLYKNVEQSKAMLKNVIDNTAEAIFSLDKSGKILTWNNAAGQLFALTREEIVGKHFSEILAKESSDRAEDFLKQVLYGNMMKNQPVKIQNKQKETIDVLVSLAPIREDDNTIKTCSVIVHSIERLTPGAKSIGEGFIQSVLYELEPTVVDAKKKIQETYVKLKNAIEADKNHPLIGAKHTLEELWRISDNLLKYKKIRPVPLKSDEELEFVDVNDILMSLILMRQEEMDQKKVTLAVPAELPSVIYTQAALTQVFNNLISVALLMARGVSSSRLSISSKDEGDYYRFILTINPYNKSAIDINSIFDTESSSNKGGSVTLAVAKEIIESYRGEINIETHNGSAAIIFTVLK